MRSKIVLCIDDDEDDRELICEAINLIDASIKVLHAASGIIGLNTLRELDSQGNQPCLIILDVNMPVMDGKEALTEIRKLNEEVPVVLFTTGITATTKELKDLVEKHHAHLRGKPNNMKEILATIKKMLDYCS